MFVCLYFGLLALGCLLLFEDAAVYFKKHCTNKHKRNLPSHVTTVNTNTGAFCRYKQTHEEGNMKHRYPTNSRANTPLTNTPHNTFLKLERLSVPAIYTYLAPSSKKSCGHAPAYRQAPSRSQSSSMVLLNPRPDVRNNSVLYPDVYACFSTLLFAIVFYGGLLRVRLRPALRVVYCKACRAESLVFESGSHQKIDLSFLFFFAFFL